MKRVIQPAPGIVAAGDLHNARHHHQLEKKQLLQKERGARDWRFPSAFWPKLPRREEDRQEAGFQQQNIPLKAEERLPGDRERQVKNEQRDKRNEGNDSGDEEQRQNNTAAAEEMEKGVA